MTRGMTIVEDYVQKEKKKLVTYVARSKKRLFGVVGKSMKDGESDKQYKKRRMKKREEKIDKKQVHGRI